MNNQQLRGIMILDFINHYKMLSNMFNDVLVLITITMHSIVKSITGISGIFTLQSKYAVIVFFNTNLHRPTVFVWVDLYTCIHVC